MQTQDANSQTVLSPLALSLQAHPKQRCVLLTVVLQVAQPLITSGMDPVLTSGGVI